MLRLSRFLVVVLALATAATHAQDGDPPPLTEADGWRSSLSAGLAGSQAAFSNWQEGGVDALAFTAAANGRFARVLGQFKQVHEGNAEFGQLRQDTLGFRKSADLARYAFALQYQGTGVLQPTAALEARTQFASGFDYDPTPDEYADAPGLVIMPGEALRVSAFAAPAYLTQVLGVTYDPDRWYTARLGLGVKETIVRIEDFRPLYGNALDEAVRVEAGLDFAAQAERPLFENVTWRSRLSLFQAFDQFGGTPDALFDNALVLKVNDILNTNLNLVLLFDEDVSEDLQIKEVLSVGVSFSLL